MADKITVIRENIYDVKGTTKLKIGDPLYFEEIAAGSKNNYLKKITFDGFISAAPIGKLKVQLNKIKSDSYYKGEYDAIDVTVAQAFSPKDLETYMNGQYYPKLVKGEYQLGCDTARFGMVTKYGSDLFKTGGDGYYGNLIHNQQHYGMILNLSFDCDMFDYDEVCERMLKLFPERKSK